MKIVNEFKRSQQTKIGRIVLVTGSYILYLVTLFGPSVNSKSDILLVSPVAVTFIFLYIGYSYIYKPFKNKQSS